MQTIVIANTYCILFMFEKNDLELRKFGFVAKSEFLWPETKSNKKWEKVKLHQLNHFSSTWTSQHDSTKGMGNMAA